MDDEAILRDGKTPTHFGKLLAAAGFNEEQRDAIAAIMVTVCHRCWDAPAGCQCSNDE